jgi:DNA-binding CsgD family transcriptional regulator
VRFVSDNLVCRRAQELYALALVDTDWTPQTVCARTGWTAEELHEAVETLAELGLAAPYDAVPSGWSVHTPAAAIARLMQHSEQQTGELLTSVTRTRSALARVLADFQPVHFQQLAEARIEMAVQPSQVAAILEEGSRTATAEVLSLHPRMRPAAQLPEGDERNREALRRGVVMRSIHLAASATSPQLRAHLRQLVRDGAEVRMATTLPMRLIIVDRTLAIVPTVDADGTLAESGAAMVLRSAAMVSVLRQVFEHCWASASDVLLDDSPAAVTDTRHREVVRLLASGLTDEAIGRKLGLSDRTVRRIVAELMQQVGAESRFQAGVKMVRMGWLDDDRVPYEDVVRGTPPGQVESPLSVSAASSTGRAADS